MADNFLLKRTCENGALCHHPGEAIPHKSDQRVGGLEEMLETMANIISARRAYNPDCENVLGTDKG